MAEAYASDSSDFDDTDLGLLNCAESVMKAISPAKTSKKKQKQSDDKAKKTRTLLKSDVKKICAHLKSQKEDIMSVGRSKILKQKVWSSHDGYYTTLTTFMDTEHMTNIMSCIFQDYIHLYDENNKGRGKYGDFQLDWFQNSAKYLLNPTAETSIFAKTLESYTFHFRSVLVSAIHNFIACECSREIIQFLEAPKDPGKDTNTNTGITSSEEDEFQMYKLHGWILKQVIDAPSKANFTSDITDTADCWITSARMLKADKLHDNLPKELRHYDKGMHDGLIFPTPKLLPFMRIIDCYFKEYSTEQDFNLFGPAVTEIIKMKIQNHIEIKAEFTETLHALCPDITEDVCSKMHLLWMQKFCNARIKNLLLAREKIHLSSLQKTTSKTQNLRDGLLAHHVNPNKKK